jgi:DNA-directed RNA polymerase subunit RPC12/RpoP
MSTATAPIRFRCFRCQKLLGVSKSKAGAVVACPQCSAELIVPEPEEPTAAPAVTPIFPPVTSQSSSASRIQPVVVPWDTAPNPDDSSSESDHRFPAIQIEPVTVKGTERVRSSRTSVSTEAPSLPPPDFSSIGKAPQAEPRPEPVVVAAVTIEAPSIRESAPARSAIPVSARSPRRDDVIVPRTAMILWSFVVLLALVFAFAAGLLAGRFVWARGITAQVPGVRSVWRTSPTIPFNPIASAHDRKYKRDTAS